MVKENAIEICLWLNTFYSKNIPIVTKAYLEAYGIFMAIVPMSSPLWYLNRMNWSILLDRQLGLIILLLELLNITVTSILIFSSLTLHVFHLPTYLSTATHKNLNSASIVHFLFFLFLFILSFLNHTFSVSFILLFFILSNILRRSGFIALLGLKRFKMFHQ